MIDHISFGVADFEVSRRFYETALAEVGIRAIVTLTPEQTGGKDVIGFGSNGKPFFWIGSGGASSAGVHIAFTASSRAQVDAFHAAALQAGGKDNGAPGPRPQYHPDYYGAYVVDVNGINLEAVCHLPQ